LAASSRRDMGEPIPPQGRRFDVCVNNQRLARLAPRVACFGGQIGGRRDTKPYEPVRSLRSRETSADQHVWSLPQVEAHCRNRTHNPSVAGSSPARPTGIYQRKQKGPVRRPAWPRRGKVWNGKARPGVVRLGRTGRGTGRAKAGCGDAGLGEAWCGGPGQGRDANGPLDRRLRSIPPVDTSPGWYEDPFGRHEQRFHDGRGWTEHVSTQGQQSTDDPVPSPPTAPAAKLRRRPHHPNVIGVGEDAASRS
jgi:Protein of unknown function (DUF2510)